MVDRVDEERRHSLCPQCQHVRGEATSLVLGRGVRTLHYQCPTCHHEWRNSVSIPISQSIFRRSPPEG